MPCLALEMMRLMTDSTTVSAEARSGEAGIIRRRVLRTVGIGGRVGQYAGGADVGRRINRRTGGAADDIRVATTATAEEAEALIDAMAARDGGGGRNRL